MSYDLRRLRLNGLITRIPRTNTCVLTPEGIRAAIFCTKVHDRLLRPLFADTHPPPELRHAPHVIDEQRRRLAMPSAADIAISPTLW